MSTYYKDRRTRNGGARKNTDVSLQMKPRKGIRMEMWVFRQTVVAFFSKLAIGRQNFSCPCEVGGVGEVSRSTIRRMKGKARDKKRKKTFNERCDERLYFCSVCPYVHHAQERSSDL